MTSETRSTVFTSLVVSCSCPHSTELFVMCGSDQGETEAHDQGDSSYCLHLTGTAHHPAKLPTVGPYALPEPKDVPVGAVSWM